ncbi:hypothetical protein K461DRAFT_318943 [Myriangium duriaei CBS 260.36]|uniref:Rhodopsin domain-containing protein n=1 Tax=Myriangium duriaei CBS 260.36 TaxID=1168546 RepID=A0A9P4J971_9PEZI|nr:hypothetical protein K461DRAFT_318943 [Myriangium duriaei CBS 260.36]
MTSSPPTAPVATGSGLQQATHLDHGNRGPAVVAGSVICTVLAACFVGLRVWRSVHIKRLRWDDALIVLSTVLLTVSTIVAIIAVSYGEGHHVWDISEHQLMLSALRLTLVDSILNKFALSMAKISVCITLVQINLGSTCNTLLIFGTFLGSVGNFLVALDLAAGCNTSWVLRKSILPHCLPVSMFVWTSIFRGAVNVFQDVIDVVVPIWFLRYVGIIHRDRRAIQIMLCFLLVASAFAITTAVLVPQNLTDVEDMTWRSAQMLCLDPAETAVSIMAACLPAIRQVMTKHLPERWQIWKQADGATSVSQSSQPMNVARGMSAGGQMVLLPIHSARSNTDSQKSSKKWPSVSLLSVSNWKRASPPRGSERMTVATQSTNTSDSDSLLRCPPSSHQSRPRF